MRSLLAFAVATMACVSVAEVIEIEGTIKSIDKEARVLSIARKTPKGEKILELEIAANAGNLSELDTGDEVSVSYDPDLEIIASINERLSPDSLLVAGSEWATENKGMRLRILTRDDDQYTGLVFVGENILREVRGSIKGNKLQWLAKDVTALKGSPGGDNFGVLSQDGKGPKLDFTWRTNSGPGGEFTLRKARQSTSKTASPTADANNLEGVWMAVKIDHHGTMMPTEKLRQQARRIIIEGDTLTFEETNAEGKVSRYGGTITVNPETKTIDLVGKGPTGMPFILLAIYDVQGDELRFAYRRNGDGTAKRPTEFKADAEKMNFSMVYTCKRLRLE